MADAPLMPKATAVWLVENTSLTFEQIAEFCQLHELEVKGIADGDVAQGIRGMDPVANDQLSRSEIERAQEDPGYRLRLAKSKVEVPEVKTKKGPKYTPLSRRQDRPMAINGQVVIRDLSGAVDLGVPGNGLVRPRGDDVPVLHDEVVLIRVEQVHRHPPRLSTVERLIDV